MANQFPTLTPYLVVDDAMAAIDFYQKALGAQVVDVMKGEDGKVMNAQLKVGDSMLMLNDEYPDYGALGPKHYSGSSVTIHISSKAVDADFQRAVDAGATVTMPLEDQFWGDRYGQFIDPFGHKWSMGQNAEEAKAVAGG
ncbi:MAG: VOC family protein [Fimbriimonadaceae bacterium]|nr:VOC family protein [Fimbriimonadaceae bacterium]QYK55983.1 MAG: VOC family protein [Fimbriimonadaceae bacterium]